MLRARFAADDRAAAARDQERKVVTFIIFSKFYPILLTRGRGEEGKFLTEVRDYDTLKFHMIIIS